MAITAANQLELLQTAEAVAREIAEQTYHHAHRFERLLRMPAYASP